ncbi:beta-ketoacyl-ACP synthase III [Acidaminobacter sp. JC074]|uniref:beta-ketoacyl-ACP synthase III n=1 Tax=Acidaminobacter sp. JC074 TaxID=2530199 RepID=UPI002102FB0E|nr:beta-ketoacyl-ACP synthase III [Acidaminobacter sp. JC074]
MSIRAGFLGTGSCLPEKEVTNFDLEKIVDTNDEWIRTRTGISSRRIADDQTATSDLAYGASLKAMEAAGVTAEELDMIIVATITPDNSFPSTACTLQDKLGAVNASAFDVSAACSGFVYASTVAMQFVESGAAKNILVVGAETLSKILDFTDRNTCVLFGDGAGAAIIGPVESGGIVAMELGAKGSGGKFLSQPAGGSRMPATKETVDNRLHYIKMDGSEVFKFAVRIMASSSQKVIEKAGWNMDELDYLVPHQANIRIINSAGKKLKLPADRVHVNLDKFGNTSAGSVPIALDEAVRSGKIKKGDKVVLVAFGGGLTWGALAVEF